MSRGEGMEINNLRRFRKGQDFTVRGLSVSAHVSTATIVAIEHYGDVPAARTREKIATALGMSESVIWPSLEVVSDGK